MKRIYVLYLKNYFDGTWHQVKAFSMFRSELEGWLETNWRQMKNGVVPVIEAEERYIMRVEKGMFL